MQTVAAPMLYCHVGFRSPYSSSVRRALVPACSHRQHVYSDRCGDVIWTSCDISATWPAAAAAAAAAALMQNEDDLCVVLRWRITRHLNNTDSCLNNLANKQQKSQFFARFLELISKGTMKLNLRAILYSLYCIMHECICHWSVIIFLLNGDN